MTISAEQAASLVAKLQVTAHDLIKTRVCPIFEMTLNREQQAAANRLLNYAIDDLQNAMADEAVRSVPGLTGEMVKTELRSTIQAATERKRAKAQPAG